MIGGLVREMKHNCRAPLAEIGNILPNRVWLLICRKDVHNLGFNSCIALKKPILNDNHKAERLAFAKEHSY